MSYAQPDGHAEFRTVIIKHFGLHNRIAHYFAIIGFYLFQTKFLLINTADLATDRVNLEEFAQILGNKRRFLAEADTECYADFFYNP